MAEQLKSDPMIYIDYLLRAYLIKPRQQYIRKIKALSSNKSLDEYVKSRVKNFLKTVT
jgi:hypothetical protein